MLIETVLPEYTIRSHHRRRVAAAHERVYAATKAVRADEIALIGLLFWLRFLPARLAGAPPRERGAQRPILDGMTSSGFAVLGERDNAEIVIGTTGQPWKANAVLDPPDSQQAFLEYQTPGTVKVAMNMSVTAEPDGSTMLRTETRILCVGPEAERTFRRYWRLVGIGSGLIRVMWLRAIARKATE